MAARYHFRPRVRNYYSKYKGCANILTKSQKRAIKKYQNSEKGKATLKAYKESEHGKKMAHKRYVKHRQKRKNKIFSYYCNGLPHCMNPSCEVLGGTKDMRVLTIDHIDGGGTKHRNKLKTDFYKWLIQNNFPEGFQVLCMNCQFIKKIENKEYSNSKMVVR